MQTLTVDTSLDVPGLGSRRAVRSAPTDPGPWPGVVMIHEAFGIDDVLRRQATRLAAAGYVVLAPDLLGGSFVRCIRAVVRALDVGRGAPFTVIGAAQDQLRADPACTGRVGVIGFCMGGGFALLSAGRGFDVSSVNYGHLPDDLDAVVAGACPVVASYGGRDRALRGSADRLAAALEAAGVRHDVKEYPDAGHSFLNDDMNGPRLLRPLIRVAGVGPEPASAADAWRRIEAFFAAELSPPA